MSLPSKGTGADSGSKTKTNMEEGLWWPSQRSAIMEAREIEVCWWASSAAEDNRSRVTTFPPLNSRAFNLHLPLLLRCFPRGHRWWAEGVSEQEHRLCF